MNSTERVIAVLRQHGWISRKDLLKLAKVSTWAMPRIAVTLNLDSKQDKSGLKHYRLRTEKGGTQEAYELATQFPGIWGQLYWTNYRIEP